MSVKEKEKTARSALIKQHHQAIRDYERARAEYALEPGESTEARLLAARTNLVALEGQREELLTLLLHRIYHHTKEERQTAMTAFFQEGTS